ncbi:AAA family ATPase [Rhodohalobacter sulfatireducens]|uniref:Cytidylate kinase-like family protein n=1 Tax=Rhodohalobacter sulfatireducens TaxID=2911366 RepID=A0ABS9KA50_9BACT|nr:cytidylate kinase-like family protein [Rhodohalobacter sulfatireducens]MCG2587730.1 cytidylate kinase-like family protein [Rhodohalobacter sulfatireducens]MDR9408054.1 cytidylate kinase-like family protein [Balneolaceae bacterium]
MSKILHKIIDEQIKTWELESSFKNKIITPKGNPYPIITISREFGARGAALATLMGEKMGFKVWDRDILQAIADKLGSSKKYLESLDENRRVLIEDVVVGFMKNVNTNVNYLRTLTRLIRTVEYHGNAIIVGRGANYICRDPHSFHVRIVSPEEKRAVDYAAREGITKAEALSIIKKTDAERGEFVRYYFKNEISDSSDYDLVLNSGTFSLQEMMAIVVEAYEQKSGLKLEFVS